MKALKNIYHWLFSWASSVFYGKPSREMFVLGVTGTKGKSTTLEMINSIIKKSGKKTALLSSVKREIDGTVVKNDIPNTMPGRWHLQKFLHDAFQAGCEYVFLEVTSQGVAQHRHKFIDWDGAMFLNLHPEHIESHGSYKKYREAKLDFFRYLKKSKKKKKFFFINKDSQDSDYFSKAAEKVRGGHISYFSSDDAYKFAERIKEDKNPDWLKADFNIENMAAAISFAEALSIKNSVIKDALENFKGVEGRMDFVLKSPFRVVVDYAHTPDSLKALLKNLRENDEFSDSSNLICVFGSAGGGRDKWKRPELGKVAGNYCDKIILTSEDPYEEDPRGIISDIKKGIIETDFSTDYLYEVVDRKKAIKKAIQSAKEGDTVAITGIGSQGYFYESGGKIPWDEKEIVKDFLRSLNYEI